MGSLPILIVDEQDKPVGSATKQEAWDKGLIHRCIRILAFNKKGEVLLQHRTPTKDIFPDCWDTSVAGHVDAGEDYKDAAKREFTEELGLPDLPLTKLGHYYASEVWKGHKFNRFNQCYTAKLEETPTKLEKDKIDGFRWWKLDDVRQLVRDHPDQVTDGLRQVFERYY